jgi:heptosyltransferase-2
MKNKQKILVIRLKQIGDALLSLPVCNSLRATYPDAQIDYLVYQHIKPLLEGQPAIDRILTITPQERDNKGLYFKKMRWLRQQGYDTVLDMINVPISATTARLTGAEQILGFDKKRWRKYLYKTAVKHDDVIGEDTVSKKLAILSGLNEQAKLVKEWQLVFSEQEKATVKQRMQAAGVDFERPVFFIAATSRKSSKFWPNDYVVEVLNHLKAKHKAQLVFNWIPGPEGDFVKETVAQLDDQNNVFADIAFNLRELAVAISLSDFFFGNDGGPNHMAVGSGVPSLAIFSPAHEKENWLPAGKAQHQGICIKDALQITEQQRRAILKEIKQDLNGYYRKISPNLVIQRLDEMVDNYLELS